jgi:hypothetical protein
MPAAEAVPRPGAIVTDEDLERLEHDVGLGVGDTFYVEDATFVADSLRCASLALVLGCAEHGSVHLPGFGWVGQRLRGRCGAGLDEVTDEAAPGVGGGVCGGGQDAGVGCGARESGYAG